MSSLEIRDEVDGIHVSCMGCAAARVFPGHVWFGCGFIHEPGCPVLRQIAEAFIKFETDEVLEVIA